MEAHYYYDYFYRIQKFGKSPLPYSHAKPKRFAQSNHKKTFYFYILLLINSCIIYVFLAHRRKEE